MDNLAAGRRGLHNVSPGLGLPTGLQLRPGDAKSRTEGQRTIAVLSPDYLSARFTQPEWAAAFAQDPRGEKGTLVPVRVKKCDLEGLLPQIVYIDLVGLNGAAARDALLTGVKRGRSRPGTAPPFPGASLRSVPDRPRFPGTLPPIWNVPHLRNPNFTGRDSLLDALTSGRRAAVTQAISGLGGVGKTHLAVEYAYRHAGDYDLVWWVRSEEPVTLAADYAGLSRELDLPQNDNSDQRIVIEAVRQWLRQNAGWLLVFDNAPGPEDVFEYIPPGSVGHVLITSRNPGWGGVAGALPVREFEEDVAVQFLLKRTNQADDEATAALAEELGYLPLALEQAGAYIEATGTSLPYYLEAFRTRQQELLGRGRPTDYPDTVATTWDISMQRAKEASAASVDLLSLCAFLAPDDIPRDLLTRGTDHLPQCLARAVANRIAFDDAVAALLRYSLMGAAGDALSVHRLVQAVVRDRLAKRDRRKWAGAAVALLDAGFPFLLDDPGTWVPSARPLPHALTAAGHAGTLAAAPVAAGRLLNQVGLYLQERAQFAQAHQALETALDIGEATYGRDHPVVAIRVNNLGGVLRDLGDLEGARACYERALRIDEADYGPDHPGVVKDVNNLGLVLRELGDIAAARAHYERALRIAEAAYGPDNPAVAIVANNLGSVLNDLGDLAGGLAHLERALRIDEATYGLDHPNVAVRINNLAGVLRQLGDPAGARAHLERALRIDEGAYGPDHPNVAIRVNNLGSVFRDQGDREGAKQHFQRALDTFRKFFDEEHPYVRQALAELTSLDT